MAKLTILSQWILNWMKNHKRLASELFLGVLTACSIIYGITVGKQNYRLSNELEMANNNIEVYQELANNSQQAFGVLKMDMSKLKESNDSLVIKLDQVRKENNIKTKDLNFAATQTQQLLVNKSKNIDKDIIEIIKDTIYTDSIEYNDLTKVYYSIGKDSVNIALDIKNTQYLYTYSTREYKNKKSFLKRLFTFDWKKETRYRYSIVNTNDLLKESDIRIIEQK